MSELPQARALVHPRGARHMVDPSALYQGALAVYGQQEMDRAYGQLVPVDAARVVSSADDMTVELAGRALTLIDTPGHARHHHCIWDEATRGWFTGDTFGLSYREFDTAQGAWILPTSTPVQFEPEALARSIDRLLARAPQWVYLTHYGRVGQVATLGQTLQRLLDETVTLARRLRDHPQRHEALKSALQALYVEDLRRHGAAHSAEDIARLLSIDIELNAQGIATWLDRQR
jgi:glyoxylase-like metal-dependent hydrolase (beta-lactamase superfamily II)